MEQRKSEGQVKRSPQPGPSIRVILADDHPMMRDALRYTLAREPDIEVIAEAGDGEELLRLAIDLKPHVVVMDVSMPQMDGIDATRRLVGANLGIKILALSSHTERPFVLRMLHAGANGYVVKSAAADELLRAIRSIIANKTYLCPQIAAVVVDGARRMPGSDLLGRREREVLILLAEGKTSAEIADKLCLATSTVEAHRRNIMRKLDLHNVVALTRYAIREGLTSA